VAESTISKTTRDGTDEIQQFNIKQCQKPWGYGYTFSSRLLEQKNRAKGGWVVLVELNPTSTTRRSQDMKLWAKSVWSTLWNA
jgi:hypothetical protein